MSESRLLHPNRTRIIVSVGLAVLLIIVWLVLVQYWPDGVDYHYHFYPDTRLWLEGKTTLFDPETSGYYHPPWGIWLLVPIVLLPYHMGLATLILLTIIITVVSAGLFGLPGHTRPWAIAFALFNLHNFDLLYRGQISGFEILGVVLGWLALKAQRPWLMGLAYLILTINPPNTIPICLWLLAYSWVQWPRRQVFTSLIGPAVVFALSLVFFPWWPLRWLENYQAAPPQAGAGWWLATIWRAAEALQMSLLIPAALTVAAIAATIWAWRRTGQWPAPDRTLARMMLILTLTFVVTPFSLGYRMVMLTAIVIPYLIGRQLVATIGLYLLTFLPITRIWIGGPETSWVDIVFVLAVFAVMLFTTTRPLVSQSQPMESQS